MKMKLQLMQDLNFMQYDFIGIYGIAGYSLALQDV